MDSSLMKEKLVEAINAKNNDVSTFVWKLARDKEGNQKEVKLSEATPEQLQKFYDHCMSMLYSKDKLNPGRYILLDLINEQRHKCNIELFLRKLESGAICANGKPYPRYLYLQDIRAYMNLHKSEFPNDKLDELSISNCTGGLPREFERISIDDVITGCLDQLGNFNTKHLTFSFILKLGVYLTPDELKDLNEVDKNGKQKSKLETIKERLNIKNTVKLIVKPSGLNFKELRAMVSLKPKKYSELTTDQLTTLRNKVLFRLEDEVQYHIKQWEEKLRQIKLAAKERNIVLKDNIETI